jgi:hypothetical protein
VKLIGKMTPEYERLPDTHVIPTHKPQFDEEDFKIIDQMMAEDNYSNYLQKGRKSNLSRESSKSSIDPDLIKFYQAF